MLVSILGVSGRRFRWRGKSSGMGVCCVKGLPRYMQNRVGESHHAHLEPLYSGWQVLKVSGTQQGY